jgi:hypothetical protein
MHHSFIFWPALARTDLVPGGVRSVLGDSGGVRHGDGASLRLSLRMGRFALLLVGILSTPGLGLALVQRSHCVVHEGSAMHHHGSTPSWTRPTHSDCPHCPATECASLAPCSTSGVSSALPTLLTLSIPLAHHLGTIRIETSPDSTLQQPPTPPPQTLA